jgi:hypothetical protein
VNTTKNNQMALISIISAGIGWIVGGLGTCAFTFFFPPVPFAQESYSSSAASCQWLPVTWVGAR